MIEVNRLIFPYPRHDTSSSHYLRHIQHNIIYVPKSTDVQVGCMCQTITHHHKNPSSVATTSRTHNNDNPPKTIKIQSSKQLKMKMMKSNHKRTSTRLINLVASQSNFNDENKFSSSNTARNIIRSNIQEQVLAIKMHKYLSKRKSKFLSDDLYEEGVSQQHIPEIKMQTVRVANVNFNISKQFNLCSKLWKYQKKEQIDSKNVIPCLYYQGNSQPNKILVYFHGNGQDIVGCAHFLSNLSFSLGISVLAMEYPGYSLYPGDPTSEGIQEDAIELIQFLSNRIGFEMKNILIFGRSIGSGPAVFISSLYQVGGLILLSPFLSLCEAVGDMYGGLASKLLKQRFDNKQRAKKVTSPCLIVHGTRDRLIPDRHATELSQYFRSYCMTKIVRNMSHSIFNHEQLFDEMRHFQKIIQCY